MNEIVKFETSCKRTKAMMGEKSSTIPGPPRGDFMMSLRIGDRKGSVRENKSSAKRLPWNIGSHDIKIRINKSTVRTLKNVAAVFKSTCCTASYLSFAAREKKPLSRDKSSL